MSLRMLYSLSSNIRKATFYNVFRVKHLTSSYTHAEIHGGQNVQPVQELDKLYKAIVIEARAHDSAVLNSYEWFVKTSAGELGINVAKIWEPFVHKYRRTLLKSIHVHGKHRVQYEFRTYFRLFELKHLTGSTADTFLEYIQRNLPEGVSMKVTKHCIEKIPEHIPVPKDGKVTESVKL